MKKCSKVLFLTLSFSLVVIFLAGCSGHKTGSDGDTGIFVRVNGVMQDGTVQMQRKPGGVVVDARAFVAKLAGVCFFPMLNPTSPGIVLQYGKKISFAGCGESTAGNAVCLQICPKTH